MANSFTDGQITHLLSLLSGGCKRPFAEEMLAGMQSGHPHLQDARTIALRIGAWLTRDGFWTL